MILIIDGYNLLFNARWPAQGNNLEEQREHLIREVITYRKARNARRVILVFDGRVNTSYGVSHLTIQGVEIFYATCSGKADAKIITLCEELSDIQLVTADQGLALRVRSSKCHIISPEDFIQSLHISRMKQNTREIKPTSTPADIVHWLEAFGLESEIEISDNVPTPPQTKFKKKKNTGW